MPLLYIRMLVAAGLLTVITTFGYLGYSKVKDIGYQEASAKYEKVIQAYQTAILTKVTKLETTSDILAAEAKDMNLSLSLDISSIMGKLKGKTLTVVKDGGCTPSATFSDSINAINKRVNENVKGSQK